MAENEEKTGESTAVVPKSAIAQALATPIDLDTSKSFKRLSLQRWHDNIDYSDNRALKLAKVVLFLVFGIGGLWAAFAPLGGAVIATGRVAAENQNRVVQHLEGGILTEVLVREGERVDAGQVLARLDTSQIGPQLDNLRLQRAVLRVQLARRRAEIKGANSITMPSFPDEMLENPRLQETIESQTSEFYALNDLTQSQIDILENKIKALRDDIRGQQAVIEARTKQEELLALELRDFKDLLEKGLVQRTRVFATERELSIVRANLSIAKLQIEKSKNEIVSTEAQKGQVRLERLKQAEDLSIELQKELNKFESEIARYEDVSERKLIKAPSNGTVFRIAKKTIGAVLAPGEALMEIVPTLENFRVEAQVAVRDIEEVYVGQDVEMRLLSVKSRSKPPLTGKITYVSADAVVSDANPQGSYIAYIAVDEGQETNSIMPGNVATVFIKTEPKTFLEILILPISRFTERAFKG
ncbi:HlyD family type I secretion periplasmic adaptor subunit [Kordiimonas sp.]|uniref:HlyD family type I secretion periplasmic adaptor subunit n=1 Tax=Kordiimonas sp. TaxID=1970157 RepID=UPI003A92A94C